MFCLIVQFHFLLPVFYRTLPLNFYQEIELLTTCSNDDRMDVKSQMCWQTVFKCRSLFQVLMEFICAVAFHKTGSATLVFSTTRFMFHLVVFRHSFSLSSLSVSAELHQKVDHYSTAVSLHGWCIHELSNGNLYSQLDQKTLGLVKNTFPRSSALPSTKCF